MSIEERLAYFTECQLATVEDLLGRKIAGRFPKGEFARHRRIADSMVSACAEFRIQPDRTHQRLRERLSTIGVTWLKQ